MNDVKQVLEKLVLAEQDEDKIKRLEASRNSSGMLWFIGKQLLLSIAGV